MLSQSLGARSTHFRSGLLKARVKVYELHSQHEFGSHTSEPSNLAYDGLAVTGGQGPQWGGLHAVATACDKLLPISKQADVIYPIV
jgi:hypothetical protein